ncbi:NarK family nitrate/nitrite MFS transporter [Funiculus sociatus GB2-A5]|uniref:Nitrate/nitrite transporter n=1 Tax=Funiculus sociatus GB2-A5 TaxID=2933946 RepID=A0ABV0JLM6_9CYAN|nr:MULTISPECIES: NarK family nitrate/nitrite MFS transporter [unclassified Trichocoleus]MBD1904003.1 NarK family nitrate/nitrite MFS transporter [Trichocoleus sp. FACHB-832]MBD2062774.1 NarK family nitrate/nitrite MFS transporter [Trichocoleus sp. FACHB-6]
MSGVWSFSGRYRILHLTWFAFFLTFVVWFNFAPFATAVKDDLGLTEPQLRTLAICNVALTVPARIIVGMILDRFGPRITYSCLLVYAAIPCLAFALAQNFEQLVYSRLALSIVGCGFVIGIRMVAEWFPAKEIGLAEGIYGGWGNFGSAGAAFTLPTIAAAVAFLSAGQVNWRFAIALTGIVSAIYGVIYYFNVQNTPPGKVYERPESSAGMEVTTQKDFWFMMLMNIPLVGVLGLIAWRLNRVNFINTTQLYTAWVLLVCLYAFQAYNCWKANKKLMNGTKRYPAEERYKFSQVANLELAYLACFGSELAVVSMLPTFFQRSFGLTAAIAGAVAGTYAFMNLVARPGGGLISDKIGSRKWTLAATLAGTGTGYLVFSSLGGNIPLLVVVIMTMTASFFVMAAEGATYAIVPLIKRRVTGQIAGNVGAYGNVGAVIFLTVYSLLPQGAAGDRIFFQMLGLVGLIAASFCAFFLKEPEGSHEGEEAEVLSPKTEVFSHEQERH